MAGATDRGAGHRRSRLVQWWRGYRCSNCGEWQRSLWWSMHTKPCVIEGFVMEPVQ